MSYNKFIYIPSFDTAIAQNAGINNFKLKSGMSWRYWDNTFPEPFRHNAFLLTAGHNFKKFDHAIRYEFPEDMIVVGDSGGYQIATGALKWDSNIRRGIFDWLEHNTNVAMNLDIPPRGKYEGRYQEALEISIENFKYFADWQTGKTDFLNILQGLDKDSVNRWYRQINGLPFKGWAFGGAGGNLYRLMTMFCQLIENKEFENRNNKWIHVLGVSSITEFLLLSYIQRFLNDNGYSIQIMADSSTPNRATAFGSYYIGYDIKEMRYKMIHVPRKDVINWSKNQVDTLPIVNEVDRLIWNEYKMQDFLEWKSEHYGWFTCHNYTIFIDSVNAIHNLIHGDSYILNQMLSREMQLILKSVDEIFNSNSPYGILKKYHKIYSTVSRIIQKDNTNSSNENTFF